jgi:hypothetical protein
VRLGQIIHMDVVSQTSPVRWRVAGTENIDVA